MELTVGMQGHAETVVVQENTAAAMGSGLLPVFATPAMVALMEAAAVNAIESKLDENSGSVGIRLDITHDAASPIGAHIRAEATITAVEGRKLTFAVKAFDDAGQIGGGVHERFIIFPEKFMAKVQNRGAN